MCWGKGVPETVNNSGLHAHSLLSLLAFPQISDMTLATSERLAGPFARGKSWRFESRELGLVFGRDYISPPLRCLLARSIPPNGHGHGTHNGDEQEGRHSG